jgi:hypothetical protein
MIQIFLMNNKYTHRISSKRILGIALLILSATSCKKFVNIDPPDTKIVTASVFNNGTTATSALINIYVQMSNFTESFNMSLNTGLLSDELTNYSTVPTEVQLYTNALLSNNDPGPWLTAYQYIYQANAIISGLQNNGSIAPVIAQQLTGESKFLRAFWHFYLTNIYGDIPLVLTTDYTVNDHISRTPQAQVYQQIITDLSDAAQLLSDKYVDATDTAATTERVRPTKWAAYAMLARTYLYMGKYDSAEIAATKVISNSGYYSLCTNLSPIMGANSVFLINSSEAILQLATPLPATYSTFDAYGYILTTAPTTGSYDCTTISPQLLNSFDSGDLRKTNWIGVYQTNTIPSINYYFPYKYQNSSPNVTEYIMLLRLAEQYLIRAEAEANLGDSSDAINDLNIIRNRANLVSYNAGTNGSLLAAIMHERQVELFTEWGHRWFDLKRTGTINSVMGGSSGVCHAKGGVWASTDQLFPISQFEISIDPRLTQNPGY